MRIALFEPDIPQNTGTMLRLATCLDVSVDLIEPMGFIFNENRMRRSGMDYIDRVDYKIHSSWEQYIVFVNEQKKQGLIDNLVLLSTKASVPHIDYSYNKNDVLILGRESQGVTEQVAQDSDHAVRVNLKNNERSLNVAITCAMVLNEALRQTDGFEK